MTTGRPGCWSKGNAAASAGAAGPFYGTTSRRKQRVAAAELSVPQDLSKDYGPTGSSGRRRRLRRGKGLRAGRIRRMAMQECTTESGRHDHATFRKRADESVRCSGFWAKLLPADRPTGLGPGSQVTGSSNSFLCNASAFDVWGGSIGRFELRPGPSFLERHLLHEVTLRI